MRVLVDLSEKDIAALERIGAAERRSRAAIIRDAISTYLSSRRKKKNNMEAAFGAWGDRGIDGVEYQRKLREEW